MRQIYPADGPRHEIAALGRDSTGQAARAAVADLAGLYAYPAAPHVSAPWVRANMIASADGAGSLSGRSGGLGGGADRLVFSVLRSLADVVVVGAGTARAEKYRPAQPGELWPQLREGRPPAPPIAVVTSRLSLDPGSSLLTDAAPDSRTIVLTTAAAPAARLEAVARHADMVVAGAERITPAGILDALTARGHRNVLVEGGPGLLAEIRAAGLLDELCLTISPVLEGGGQAGRILAAPAEAAGPPASLTLAHVLEDDGFLLCRYLTAAATR